MPGISYTAGRNDYTRPRLSGVGPFLASFTWDNPEAIARSLRRSAEASDRRKAERFDSAMSMLTFYINRAGSNLDEDRKAVLEAAKDELRKLYGKDRKFKS